MRREIVHVDMDCFYAAVEMVANPALRHLPVAVGGTGRRSVLCTCNYRARAAGVRSAMPVFLALQKCPDLVILPPDFDKYQAVSSRIHRIFKDFSPVIESISLDEAFLDLSGHPLGGAAAASEIRRRIRRELRLPASAGIAPNKLLAKIASDWNKPNGQFEICPEAVDAFMLELPVRRLWGVGPRAEEKLAGLGCRTCGELQQLSQPELHQHFGSFGGDLYQMCRGQDQRPVEPGRERKSLSVERTLPDPLACPEDLDPVIERLYLELQDSLAAHPDLNNFSSGPFVKVKFSNFQSTTLSRSGAALDLEVYRQMVHQAFNRQPLPARLLGLGVRFDHGTDSPLQLELFPEFTSINQPAHAPSTSADRVSASAVG